jgi:hypothetical protein
VLPLALANVSFGEFLVVLLLDAGVSMWVYWHASRNRSRRATAWGIMTFLFPVPALVVYLIHFYATRRRF